MRRNLQI